jgi:hypothetical protein
MEVRGLSSLLAICWGLHKPYFVFCLANADDIKQNINSFLCVVDDKCETENTIDKHY